MKQLTAKAILGFSIITMVIATMVVGDIKEEVHVEEELDTVSVASKEFGVSVIREYVEVMSIPEYIPEEAIVTKVVDEADVEYLAHAMFCENGISDDEALLLTGIVIMKRVKSDLFPDTIEGVITDKRYGIQYACYWNGAWEKYQPDERALEMARRILEEDLEKDYPDGLVFQAEFKQGSRVFRHIGNQYFCEM